MSQNASDLMVYHDPRIMVMKLHDLFLRHHYSIVNIKVLEKCTKNLIGHSRLAFNNHESNNDC